MMRPLIDDKQVFETLLECQRQGEPCALAILVDSNGSVPAGTGAKMLVTGDGRTVGTVGGGGMEFEVVRAAANILREGKPKTLKFMLTKEAGYVCGGHATIYIEPVLPAPRLIIAGAGHVGQALCALAAYVGFSVTVADDRRDYAAPELLPEAEQVVTCEFESLFDSVTTDADTFVVCATRGHAHDYTVVKDALKTQARYVGLVGSRQKKASFFDALRNDGFDNADLARVYTPVGLDIGAATPREIAVSIVSELIQTRRKHG